MRFHSNIQPCLTVLASPFPDSPEHIRVHFANKVIGQPFGTLFFFGEPETHVYHKLD
jgi:hypothetical protein